VEIIYKKGGEIMLENYLAYLDKNKNKFPPNAREFAFLPCHYQIKDRRCPHDSWVDSIIISEIGAERRKSKRIVSITAKFIGAYQDGFFELVYKNVEQYEIALGQLIKNTNNLGHGDWIVDELILTSSEQVSHEIELSNSRRWKVICDDILYNWHSM